MYMQITESVRGESKSKLQFSANTKFSCTQALTIKESHCTQCVHYKEVSIWDVHLIKSYCIIHFIMSAFDDEDKMKQR